MYKNLSANQRPVWWDLTNEQLSPGEPLLVPGVGGEQQPVQLEPQAVLGVPLGQLLPLHAGRALVTEYLTRE